MRKVILLCTALLCACGDFAPLEATLDPPAAAEGHCYELHDDNTGEITLVFRPCEPQPTEPEGTCTTRILDQTYTQRGETSTCRDCLFPTLNPALLEAACAQYDGGDQ